MLLESLPSREVGWQLLKRSHTKLRLAVGDAEVELRFAPVALDVSVGGEVVLAWNQDKQFIYEHHREKKVRRKGRHKGERGKCTAFTSFIEMLVSAA